MKRRLSLLTGVMLGALAMNLGCSGGGSSGDGGTGGDTSPGTDIVTPVDTGSHADVVSTGDGAAPYLFQPCTSTTDCAGLGVSATCDKSFPGGICTISCTTDRACMTTTGSGLCFQNLLGSSSNSTFYCVPTCTTSMDCFPLRCIVRPNASVADRAEPVGKLLPAELRGGKYAGVPRHRRPGWRRQLRHESVAILRRRDVLLRL